MSSIFHLRMFWGAFDVSYATPEYSGTALVSGGSSAAAGSGVGIRRAILVYDRTPPGTFSDDVAEAHFDFINFTGGSPDDTWTTGDYTTLEGYIDTWFASVGSYTSSRLTLREIRWYRVGNGIVGANPAERVHPVGTAGTGSSDELPPQVAVSLTLKTARRKQWGRTYLPGFTEASNTSAGVITPTHVDTLCTVTETLATSAQSSDFLMGVWSPTAGSFFAAEQIQVDDLWDVIRRRRWRNPTHKKILP